MQCIDLQKIDGRRPMPKLVGYIGDSEARNKPVSMKLTYAVICHMNCCQEKRMTGMALCQNVHERGGDGTDERLLEIFHAVKDLPYLQLAPRQIDRENQWKERVGLHVEMKDRSNSLQSSVQADEALLQWVEHYGKEHNFIVTIGHWQFNLWNDMTTVKEMLTPNQQTMWGIISIIHELAKLLQQRDRDRFILGDSHIFKNLWRVAMKLVFTDDQRGFMHMEKNAIHRQRHLNFLQYCLQDGTLLWAILDGILMQMKPNVHLTANQKSRYWDTQDLFLQLLEMQRECLQRPIFMLPPVALDPRIPVTPTQREHMLKAAQAIWDDFKIKTHNHVAPKYQTS